MFNLCRSRLLVATTISLFTVAACCLSSESKGACPGPQAAPMEPGSGDDMGSMVMPTDACPLVILTKNDPDPPLYPYIGSAHWHVPWAQDYFDQGLRFLFAFNNRESYRAFRKAAAEAEDNGIPCSACYWAQALVLGLDLNLPVELEPDRQKANKLLKRAAKANPNPEDSEIINALTGRYQDCKKSDTGRDCQRARNRAYYNGMEKVLKKFGTDDPNVITLFADAAMNLVPWRYWDELGNPVPQAPAEIPKARNELERALQFVRYPPNEGPIHWYIHLMEQSPWPAAAKGYADWLAPVAPWMPLAPNAGHLVHMSSHIYLRIGDMRSAIRANKEAIEADERYFAEEPDLYRPDGDRYRYGYYLHNINFVIGAAALSGDEHDVNHYAEKLFESAPDRANGFRADTYRTAYYLAKLNFSSTPDIREFTPPSPVDEQPLANIAYDYTQLMADIWDGKNSKRSPDKSADKMDADVATYRKIARKDDTRGNPNCVKDDHRKRPKAVLCLATIISGLGHAQLAASKGNWKDAVDAAKEAVRIQEWLPYDEPPLWPYPARQTLASMLIRKADAEGPKKPQGQVDLHQAELELETSLNEAPDRDPTQIPTGTFPGNGWAYYGLWEIAKRKDPRSQPEIDGARAELDRHWFGTPQFQTLNRL
jgi:tetratricopeptide (TPR) repeat protein